MKLRMFSVVGEALNFGMRRMETIMRVAWLPVLLLLVVNMATVFAYLSVIAGRVITFRDISAFSTAEQALAQFAAQGWTNDPAAMGIITAASLVAQTVLVASFMAPLIRYAGLGERPGPGVVRAPFGPDQIRYILASLFSALIVVLLVLAPAAAAAYYILQYIAEALSQTMASFPDPDSLHTIELITAKDALIAKGETWIYDLGLPLMIAAPLLALVWVGLMVHFHPSNRNNAGPPNFMLRALVTGFVTFAFAGILVSVLVNLAERQAGSGAGVTYAAIMVAVIFYLYLNTRLYPYAGVAVCRKSLAPGKMLRVSRGWNLIRLLFVLFAVSVILAVAQFFINNFALGAILATIRLLYGAVIVSTKLVNSGVTAEWVAPLFIWIWSGVKILINVFWTFFSYGAIAGLYGRLYRESERGDSPEDGSAGPAIWRRA